MEPESLDFEDSGDHQPSPEASLASDEIHDDSLVSPRIGSEHQAEIPNMATEDERLELMASSRNDSSLHRYAYPVVVGLALPITWATPSEVNKAEEVPEMKKCSESGTKGSTGDLQIKVSSTCATSNDTSNDTGRFEVPVLQIKSDSNQGYDDKMVHCPTKEGQNVNNNSIVQQRETKQLNPLPCSPIPLWSDLEAQVFLLGLYIFGKNLNLLSRFLGTKTVGDVLEYYYGRFYGRDAYKRWSDCRKVKTRKCIIGECIFQGQRRQKLISRLKSKIPTEAHDSLIEVFKSFSYRQTSLKEFVFSLKNTVGPENFVEAVGIGKGKHDLTGFITVQSKANHAISVHSHLPRGKDCSSLGLEDIIMFLNGHSRRSKARSNDIFWEAVWPRLLAKGWHSEKPKDVRRTKNCLVFLVPGIKKFSRSKLTKGTHYFDSVSDVLKRVAADPVLIELEVDSINNGLTAEENGRITAEENGRITHVKLNRNSPLHGYQDLPKFEIIDTSLVEEEEPFNVRELRNLPADANFTLLLSQQSSNMMSYSSSEVEGANYRLSDEKEDCGQDKAVVKETEMVSDGSLQNMVTAKGHSSNGNNDKIDLTGIYGIKTKPERNKYLSPVSEQRTLNCCSNELETRCSFSFSKSGCLEKENSKLLLTSFKQAAVEVGGTFQSKTIANYCTKEKPSEQKADALNSPTNNGQNETMFAEDLINKSLECKVDAVNEVRSKITADQPEFVKERYEIIGPVDLNKKEMLHDDKATQCIDTTSLENLGSVKVDEAPTSSDKDLACDPSGAAGRPVSEVPNPALQVTARRHGTRNRPPTAKALEAIAFGLLGSGKRKFDLRATGKPSQRAHKAAKHSIPVASSVLIKNN